MVEAVFELTNWTASVNGWVTNIFSSVAQTVPVTTAHLYSYVKAVVDTHIKHS